MGGGVTQPPCQFLGVKASSVTTHDWHDAMLGPKEQVKGLYIKTVGALLYLPLINWPSQVAFASLSTLAK